MHEVQQTKSESNTTENEEQWAKWSITTCSNIESVSCLVKKVPSENCTTELFCCWQKKTFHFLDAVPPDSLACRAISM